MSNLSELLPTGGGQNAVDFVASGTLSSGQTVALKTDGTVEAVAEESATASVGSTATFSSTYLSSIAGCYDTLNNKLVLSYRHEFNSNYGTVVVGTVSGTSISFGTPVIFESGLATSNGITFDSNAGKVLLTFRNSSAQGEAIVGTVSGTSISFGSSSIWESSYSISPLVLDYDSNAQKSLIVARKDGGAGDSYIYGYVATISGTSVSFGTRGTISPSNNTAAGNLKMAYDSSQNQFVIIYPASLPSNSINVIAAEISGTSVSGGTPVEVLNNQTSGVVPDISYSPLAEKFLAIYCDASEVLYGVPVTNTNLTLTLGTAVSSAVSPGIQLGISYDVFAQTFTVLTGTTASSTQGKVIQAEVSASGVLSWGTQTSYTTGTARNNTPVYDPDTQKTLIAYHDNTAGKSAVYTTGYTRTNYTDFIGITAEAISDTATGAVNVYGGINEAQTGLTIGSDYYVQDNGSLSTATSTVKVGKAISATTINMMDLT